MWTKSGVFVHHICGRRPSFFSTAFDCYTHSCFLYAYYGNPNPAARPLENFDPGIRGHARIEALQGLGHLVLEVCDERVDSERLVEGLIIGL